MKKGFILALVVAAACSQAVTITQWNFNSNPPDANTSTGITTPNIGSGTASLIGGVTGSFSSGDSNGGSSDPATGDDSGWQTTGYPTIQAASGTAGVQFAVSTAGFSNIMVSFDTRHSNTSSRYIRLDFSTNGGSTWTNSTVFDGNAGDTWFNGSTVDLSSFATVNNNSNFVVRMVTVFAPGGGAYVASNSSSTYAATGTLRWDMVTVSGNAVPEPASMAALGIGALAMLRRRKK